MAKSVSTSKGSEVSELLIAVDVGRSSVKAVYGDGAEDRIRFPSTFSLAESEHSKLMSLKDSVEVQEAVIDGKYWLMGESARKMGDYVMEATEGDTLRDITVAACMYSVARAIHRLGRTCKNVSLAINLTYDNFYMKSEYQKLFDGEHKVSFPSENIDITFNIHKSFVMYQGYTAMLSEAMDPVSMQVGKDYSSTSGIVVDIGRRTVDISFIDSLIVKSGKSYDFGTMKVLEQVEVQVKEQFKVVKTAYEIEKYYTDNKVIRTMDGKSIDIGKLIPGVAKTLYPQLSFILKSFFESKTPDYLMVTGGGALIFGSMIKEEFPMARTIKDPVFSNAVGMRRFLCRVYMKSSVSGSGATS
jgi:hypothetical protein